MTPSAVADPPVDDATLDPTKVNTSGWPYRFDFVPIKDMIVDEDYQRPLTSLAKEIEKDYEPALIGTLCLSERVVRNKSKFAVVDGQNRMVGMRNRGITEAPSIVYHDLTPAQEAALFAKFQLKRRGITSAARFKANVMAGDEPQVTINNIVQECGFFIEHNSSDPMSLKAVAALEFLFQGTYGRKGKDRQDPGLVRDVLTVVKQSWPGVPDTAKSADMLKGLGWFLAREPSSKKFQAERTTPVNMEHLVKRLSMTTPSKLAERARKFREANETSMSGNSPSYLAEAIVVHYESRGKVKD